MSVRSRLPSFNPRNANRRPHCRAVAPPERRVKGHRVALAGPLPVPRRGREQGVSASGKERGEDERMITLPWLMWTRRSVDPGF